MLLELRDDTRKYTKSGHGNIVTCIFYFLIDRSLENHRYAFLVPNVFYGSQRGRPRTSVVQQHRNLVARARCMYRLFIMEKQELERRIPTSVTFTHSTIARIQCTSMYRLIILEKQELKRRILP